MVERFKIARMFQSDMQTLVGRNFRRRRWRHHACQALSYPVFLKKDPRVPQSPTTNQDAMHRRFLEPFHDLCHGAEIAIAQDQGGCGPGQLGSSPNFMPISLAAIFLGQGATVQGNDVRTCV